MSRASKDQDVRHARSCALAAVLRERRSHE